MVSDAVAFIDDLEHLNDLEDQIFTRMQEQGGRPPIVYQPDIYRQMCQWFGEPA